MRHVECVVIGAGQAGLAMSRCLADHGVDHVVLERGRIAERWRSERWDSLRLLTPNWQSRLPGFSYDGSDPDGYMTMPQVVDYFDRYATSFGAPVETGVDVRVVTREGKSFRVETTRGQWTAQSIVVATGHAQRPSVPAVSRQAPSGVSHLTPSNYRSPGRLPEGDVLVVGASASGIQLADELNRAGRNVTIAVGHHTRLPRLYRGRDILWWLDRMGVLDEPAGHVYDLDISRDQPSLQLVGHPDRRTLDLATLRDRGVRVAGRLVGFDAGVARFADDLVATTAAADIKLATLLRRIDTFIADEDLTAETAPPFTPHCLSFIDSPAAIALYPRIRTIVWATGFRREYPWLHVPVLDSRGEIVHDGGITSTPGVYVIGLHFLRRRNSNFIDGVGADARVLSEHLVNYLEHNLQRYRRSEVAS
jgi:putative flavoprotein involved in K+ transport